ncbi:MAG: sporulation protein YqfD [Defluviitaleaceae bacterium]|nr:sporulation protein YqfD [Defluviitaleaceae bacterium]MCL2262938.1 sporulation protein YqfD [Defluviitaleaceae bacterium]
MILNVWQFAKGYVRLAVTGFNVERFLNMAAFRGVYLWDVTRTEKGIELNVSIGGFRVLKGCAKKTNCRTKIVEKNGVPFFLHRYRKRKILMGGVLFFVMGLMTLASFVWHIEIDGNEAVTHETIMTFLEGEGLRTGALKFRLSDREIQAAILNNFSEISWADVYTRGTRTTVLIAEALPPKEIFDRKTPVHVVAQTEGLITAIVTGAGAPLVRQNDIVREGDMLVSGILELDPEMPGSPNVYVHAYAEVWARRYHTLEFSVPFAYEEKVFTGQIVNRRAVQLLFAGNRRINLPGGGNSFESYDRITTHQQIGASGDYPLPFVIVTERFYEFAPTPRTRTPEQAAELAERILNNRIIREFDFATDIINREINLRQTPDALHVNALITTHERIDKQIPIRVEEKDLGGSTPNSPARDVVP